MIKRLDEIVRAGGEGLMLHRANTAYETGRSTALLKYTPWLDAEATVIGHLPGKGRHAGRLGALPWNARGAKFLAWQRTVRRVAAKSTTGRNARDIPLP